MEIWWLAGLAALAWAARKLVAALIWRPLLVTRMFADQGVRGPPYRILRGSVGEMKELYAAADAAGPLDHRSHDIAQKVVPHYLEWSRQYGETFLYWMGTQPRLFMTDAEMVKQVLSNFTLFPKEKTRPSAAALLGQGLVLSEGLDWVRHRRLVSPAFAIDKLKAMTSMMADITGAMIEDWEARTSGEDDPCVEIEMQAQFLGLTADIIARAAFGVAGDDGKNVFEAQMELQKLAFATTLDLPIPLARYIPTKGNLTLWRKDRRLKKLLREIIQRRLDGGAACYGDDLLGMMMNACRLGDGKTQTLTLTMEEIMDECKTFFFAGHETTAHLLTWTMYLLSVYPSWQDQLRREVFAVCGPAAPPLADQLPFLKLMTMVLLESARLYSPVPIIVFRQAAQDAKLGRLRVPKGTSLTIALPILHQNAAVWGEHAGDFDPTRFAAGAKSAAAHPNAMLAFSVGPRSCVGRDMAMMEAKIALAMVLRKFEFSLSSRYRHWPQRFVTLRPKYGVPLIVRPLSLSTKAGLERESE